MVNGEQAIFNDMRIGNILMTMHVSGFTFS